MRAFYDHVQYQYKDALEIYEEKAVLHVDNRSFTDLKYQGYQENIGNLIQDLRDRIASYNQEYSEKVSWSKTIVGISIVLPDEDMKPLELRE
jgi:hypothetical protein